MKTKIVKTSRNSYQSSSDQMGSISASQMENGKEEVMSSFSSTKINNCGTFIPSISTITIVGMVWSDF
jgi:hypothetical protein